MHKGNNESMTMQVNYHETQIIEFLYKFHD